MLISGDLALFVASCSKLNLHAHPDGLRLFRCSAGGCYSILLVPGVDGNRPYWAGGTNHSTAI